MSSLASHLRAQFRSRDRTRGRSAFIEGRVWLRMEPDGVSALVPGPGTHLQRVHVGWELPAAVTIACDCPEFEEAGRCSHVWAAMLAADLEASVPRDVPRKMVEVDLSGDLARLDLAGKAEPPGDGWDRCTPNPRPENLRPTPAADPVSWSQLLGSIRSSLDVDTEPRVDGPVLAVEVYYVLDVETCISAGGLAIALFQRAERQDGRLGAIQRLPVRDGFGPGVQARDREWIHTLSAIAMRRSAFDPWHHYPGFPDNYHDLLSTPVIAPGAWTLILPRLAATGRLLLWTRKDGEKRPDPSRTLSWDDGPPFQLRLEVDVDRDGAERDEGTEAADDGPARIRGLLHREGEERTLSEPELLLAQGLVVFPDRIARLDAEEHFAWISRLRRSGEIELPRSELAQAITALHELPRLPPLDLPAEIQVRRETTSPVPRIRIDRIGSRSYSFLRGRVTFQYGDALTSPRDSRTAIADGDRLLERDPAAERAALDELAELELERVDSGIDLTVVIRDNNFLPVVERLLASGWHVEAHGGRLRTAGSPRLTVASGVDWFEVRGGVDFDGTEVPFPTLLRAARRGDSTVQLGDGSTGLLPHEWLSRWGGLAGLALDEKEGALRFARSQGFLLDLLLADLPEVELDSAFHRYRDQLDSLREITPAPEPRGFRGELRPYQRAGLGWLRQLAEAGMGGCLADDMGLGKTVQALAWLQWRRTRPVPAEEKRPSIVVAPRSLVFNWAREAERFAPRLRVLEYAGPNRAQHIPELGGYDLVITTYDTLWRDIEALREVRFDTAILDEAQAIKNPDTQRAKACRLLDADHRFALTGTPVENHLGDLWSIFEFLNPGLLGRLGQRNLARKTPATDQEQIEKLARAISPFILRRTKEQVASDLPRKTEQVLYCQLSGRERHLYDEIKRRFQAQIEGHLQERGLARSKIHVLEALLRLRQAACHVGLVDPERTGEGSAKVDLLLEQLVEVLDEGHKALVFSQFTKLLGIVRHRLEGLGIEYEYLDGRTRNRAARVDRFQEDPECPVFLVSLKAGGVGLNLTAAEYVFILDPWWNPAVESQAVDRTHRIGQTQPVFAYRLISRETVEEKVLQLQERKRELAEAVVGGGEKGFVGGLTREDLEVLLG